MLYFSLISFFLVEPIVLLTLYAPVDVGSVIDGDLRGRAVAVTIQYFQHITASESVFRPRLAERAPLSFSEDAAARVRERLQVQSTFQPAAQASL